MTEYPNVFRWDMAIQAIEADLVLEINHMNPEQEEHWIRLIRTDCVHRTAWYRVYIPTPQMNLELR